MANYYQLLGVKPDATAEEIKKAYRKRARAFHPDTSPTGADTRDDELFALINEAYEVLSNPDQRASYDRKTARDTGGDSSSSHTSSTPPPPPPPWEQEAPEWGTENQWDDGRSGRYDAYEGHYPTSTPPWEQGHSSPTQERVTAWDPDDEEEEPTPLRTLAWNAVKSLWRKMMTSRFKHMFLVALLGLPLVKLLHLPPGYDYGILGGGLILAFLAVVLGGRRWRLIVCVALLMVQAVCALGALDYQLESGDPTMWIGVGLAIVFFGFIQGALIKGMAKRQKEEKAAVAASQAVELAPYHS